VKNAMFHEDGTDPVGDWIFVFGSNLAGRHGKGAAKVARDRFGAVYGVGYGRTGMSYAIATKDIHLRTLPLESIKADVDEFLHYARSHPEKSFFVTRIGCGLAGYSDAQIAPMFFNYPPNCSMPLSWKALF
jgi:hypothetical protein